MKVRKIELLAPAKNIACGKAAIDHGADAVYIGAPRFGARSAASNTLDDIANLVTYAHLFYAKVYVTLNTILKNDELEAAEKLVWDLYQLGVDALIVQDMAFTQMNLPPIPLHASTQMDNRTPEKVSFLAEAGFDQVVLARELSLKQIAQIHQKSEVPLEVFVHGALCVSYSGQCYVSEACYGRSANRGECAQFCRLRFHMEDADGKRMTPEQHLLSLKDLNQSDHLEELLDAGASSLKIEGRLKDENYVKNVTAYYRQKLDAIFKRRSVYEATSSGCVDFKFQPALEKSFNRGFTSYFLKGRQSTIAAPKSPKSIGEFVGTVKELRRNYLTVAGIASFANGDGICYYDEQGVLKGFRVNRVENNKLFPQEMPAIKAKTRLYRNVDAAFEKQLQQMTAQRKIGIKIKFAENNFGFTLTLEDEDKNLIAKSFEIEKQLAKRPQQEMIVNQLSKLGNTPFELIDLQVDLKEDWFIPTRTLNAWRREAIDALLTNRATNYVQRYKKTELTHHAFEVSTLSYLGNVMNKQAVRFYQQHGVENIAPAFEQKQPSEAILMFCKHCLRYSLAICPKYHKKTTQYREPYYLIGNDGKRFKLAFDCAKCQMKVLAEE